MSSCGYMNSSYCEVVYCTVGQHDDREVHNYLWLYARDGFKIDEQSRLLLSILSLL